MTEKQTGYILLVIGVVAMLFAAAIMILTFTGKMHAISLFNIPAPSINTGSFMPSIPGLPTPAGQNIQVIPTAAFNNILNLGVEYLLMLFILNFGFKLGDLGVKLLRPIKITEKS